MAKSIKLGSDTYLDASGVDGIKASLTSADTIENLKTIHDSGAYYCSNVPDAPASYGMLLVLSASSGGTAAAYQVFFSSGISIYMRYRVNSTWGAWRIFTGTPVS